MVTIKTFDQRIAEAFKEHDDHEIFASLPGAGPVLAPRLLATMGSQRERFESAAKLQNYTGIAPVTKQRAANATFTGVTFVQSSIGRVFTSTPSKAFFGAGGQRRSISNSVLRALIITLRFALWLTNGNASSGAAGKVENLMKKRPTKPPYERPKALWSNSWIKLNSEKAQSKLK